MIIEHSDFILRLNISWCYWFECDIEKPIRPIICNCVGQIPRLWFKCYSCYEKSKAKHTLRNHSCWSMLQSCHHWGGCKGIIGNFLRFFLGFLNNGKTKWKLFIMQIFRGCSLVYRHENVQPMNLSTNRMFKLS